MIENKGQSALFKILLFALMAFIGYVMFTAFAKIDWPFEIPFWGDPGLLLWVVFIVLVISFGWKLKNMEL